MYFVHEQSLHVPSQGDKFTGGSSFRTFGVTEVMLRCKHTSKVLTGTEKQLDLEIFFQLWVRVGC